MKNKLSFDQVVQLYNHIGEEERHFNQLELEYRKLASQWLLVALGAIGFVISKENLVPINVWILVISICLSASIGIFVLWLLDIKVYHELLHSAFKEGVALEKEYPELLPQIRNNMVNSQTGGDVIKRVILYYFFSILLLILIANIAIWMSFIFNLWISIVVNFISCIVLYFIFRILNAKSSRVF